ncbi:MAG: lipoyl(octanoyl) transferase LipB [Bacteroidetes bacterium]|jgi:lipoyl(octanoyl) transferase|nr:lipoyl(octanoyl) transferase LipB [Bacteroidota bacterium]MBP6648070.1 lipoyl(octanoyl) transferase LipB [Bacteroidia bacterium]
MQPVLFRDLGLIDYKEAWEYQEKLFQELIERKLKNRALPVEEQEQQHHYLLFCEHPHVYTLGRSGLESNLLLDEEGLKSIDAVFYKNNRGGDITYHGPGQIVGYPILDLDLFFTDIHKYLRFLEEAIILTLKDYNISAGRFPGYTGVWLDPEDEKKARKICAIGVRTSRWVTMHGFAFNVNSNLNYFANIIPCGIEDKAVTSLEKELGAKQNISEVKAKVKEHLGALFGMEFGVVNYEL